MTRFMRKVGKSFRYGEKGFTLIELLIVVAILGILAAVVLPRVSGFLATGNLASANSEVATVKTASAAYYADGGTFPIADSNAAFYPTTGKKYLDKESKATYTFDEVGVVATGSGYWDAAPHNFTFSSVNQTWYE